MMLPLGLAALTDPSTVGVTVCDPTTDNACLLQQDITTLQQQAQAQQAAAIVAAQQAANPLSGISNYLLLGAVGAAAYFAWKSGAFRSMALGGGSAA